MDMIERHVNFEVIPEKSGQFEDFFKEQYRPAMGKSDGFVSVELVQEMEKPARYQMLIRFESLEQAAAWRNSEAHKALSPVLKGFYTASDVTVYKLIS
jgi:heme-degrading monooxygenase HmoA